jgi:drug/metabolite transporter (DMT)-like permease
VNEELSVESKKMERLPAYSLLLLAGLSLFWGINWPIIKIVLAEIPVWTFRTLCLVCGGLGLLGLVRVNGVSLNIPKKELGPLLIVAAMNVTGWHLCSAYGVYYMQAGRASIIAYTMPVWAAILSVILLKEPLGFRQILGLFLGVASLATLIGPAVASLRTTPVGAIFMLGAAVSWAAGTVFVKYFRWTMPTSLLTAWQLVVGSLPVLVGALIMDPVNSVLQLSPKGIIAMVYMILFPMIFCYWAWFKVVSILPATIAAICTLSIPVIGVFTSALMLGEEITLLELVALGLVLLALSAVIIQPVRAINSQ